MLVVGLTGGISSGKTTVSEMFRERCVPVICADELAHHVVSPGSPALEEIRRVFGDEVFDSQGGLDRVAMGGLVFRNSSKRKLLESIIHPRVSDEKNKRLLEAEGQGHELVIVDVPLLYETAWERNFDVVIVAYVQSSIQEKRLALRDEMSRQEIRSRIDSQMSVEEKRKRADIVIDNTGSFEQTRRQVDDILKKLQQMAFLKKKGCAIQRFG